MLKHSLQLIVKSRICAALLSSENLSQAFLLSLVRKKSKDLPRQVFSETTLQNRIVSPLDTKAVALDKSSWRQVQPRATRLRASMNGSNRTA